MKRLRPGFGIYRGHEYKMRSRHAFHGWCVEVDGERHTEWHATVADAVADFKAGVDDVLGPVEATSPVVVARVDVEDVARELFSAGYRSCERAESAGYFITSDRRTRFEIDSALLRLSFENPDQPQAD